MIAEGLIAALCRRNTFECNVVPRLSVALAGDSEQSLTCRCDIVVKPIDPFGYHMVGCKVGANAIRLHDEVVFTLANLFRSIGIEPVVEPVRLFDADPDLDDRRRPDILIRNPRGFDRQVILDVAVTGADLFGRVTHDDPYKPLEDTNKRLINICASPTRMDYSLFLLCFLIQVKCMEKLNALLRIKFDYS